MSKFLRFAIKADNIVSLQKELEYVRNYLFIEKIRYQNRLLVLIDVPEELNSYAIPKLTLQPLIENAIIHGFNDSFKEMLIAVTAASDDSSVILHIKDNGCGISEEIIDKINHLDPFIDMDDKNTGCNGIGLMNIQKRLRLTYGNNYGISIQKNFKDGTHILICIPKSNLVICQTEFQIKIGDKISFLPGHAFNKVKTIPCETFQSKKLAAAPRLGFNVSGSCIVCNNKGINRIRFTKSYIAFLVVCSTFRVQDKT